MKRAHLLIIVFCLLVITSTTTYVSAQTSADTVVQDAQTANSVTTGSVENTPIGSESAYGNALRADREVRRVDRSDLSSDRVNAIKNKKSEHAEKIRSGLASRIKPYMDRLFTRAGKFIARFEQIIPRIESRMAKIAEEQNVDVSTAQSYVDSAKTKVELAKTELATARATYEAGLSSNDPKDIFFEMRDSLKKAKSYLMEARDDLRKAIVIIKKIVAGAPIDNLNVDTESSKSAVQPTINIEK